MSRLEDMAAQSVYRGATAAMSSSLLMASAELLARPLLKRSKSFC
jgi:hypothetical protein